MTTRDSLEAGLAQIGALEEQRYAALKENNLKALEGMLAEDLLYVHSTGLLHGKKEYLELLRAGTVRYLEFQPTGGKTIMVGDSALVNVRLKSRLIFSGKELQMENQVTCAWARRPEGWRLVLFQATPVKDAQG
jgi:ketosteroid isomerase-like protein